MGSSGVQVSRGWLDTIKALLFPCSDSKDPRSEFGPGVYRSHPMDDGLLRDESLNRQGPSEKKYYQVYYDQPAPMPPPRARRQRSLSMTKVRKESKRAAAKQTDMGWIDRNFRSGKRKAPRPMISNPFDFQHTGTGAVSFMASAADLPRSAPPAPPFRPLELSIYQADDQISPLMPYFTNVNAPSPPPRALTKDVFDEDASTLAHSRSYSSQSFHIPRRPVNDVASFMTATTSSAGDSPPRIPPRARTRPRAYTSPSVEAIVERIASAMIEKERLDEEIESVKERQSFCLSRPSSVFGIEEDEEPMPPMPLLPPSGPSFAERLSIDRPRTAPSTRSTFETNPPLPPPPPPQYQERSQSVDEPRAQQAPPSAPPQPVPASAFNSHPPWRSPKIIDNSVNISVPLAPPLPLILRPPLRKKKSFSRVSSWLFPAGVEDRERVPSPQHRRDVSLDSVTNAPRALTDREGFYQTLPPSAVFSGRRSSFGSMSDITRSQTHSVYSTDEDPFIGPGTATATSNWSPGSTPPENARRKDSASTSAYMSGHSASLSLSRTGTFGSRDRPVDGVAPTGPRPTSVGVAF